MDETLVEVDDMVTLLDVTGSEMDHTPSEVDERQSALESSTYARATAGTLTSAIAKCISLFDSPAPVEYLAESFPGAETSSVTTIPKPVADIGEITRKVQ